MPSNELPEGLSLLPDYVSEDYEQQLLELIKWTNEDCVGDGNTGKLKSVLR